MFQTGLTVHAINTDSAMGTSFFTEDRSSCRFSEDEEVCMCVVCVCWMLLSNQIFELK